MNDLWKDLDFCSLSESHDLECKAAQGRDGRGELPEDFWKSYSAMANTEGGLIFLGVQEKPTRVFKLLGLTDIDKVRKALWDNLNNRKHISANLLTEANIEPIQIEGKTLLRIEVPRADRHYKPVHLGTNPFAGTYLRRYEGDTLLMMKQCVACLLSVLRIPVMNAFFRTLIFKTLTWIRLRRIEIGLPQSNQGTYGVTCLCLSFWNELVPMEKIVTMAAQVCVLPITDCP